MNSRIYRDIIDNAPDAILYADREGVIQLWNAGAERIFGFSAPEAIGQSLDLIIPDKQRPPHWDGYFRVMGGTPSKYGSQLLSVPALHKDGHRLFCDFSIVMVTDERGTPQGVAAILRDTSEQKNKEKQLKERIKALEAN